MPISDYLAAMQRRDHRGMVVGHYVVGERRAKTRRHHLYEGTSLDGGERVDIKLIRRSWLNHLRSCGLVANPYIHELRLANELGAEGAIQHLDVGSTAALEHYIVRELPSSNTARAAIQRSGTLDLPAALGVVASVAGVVRRVHALGYVHLDLRPDNVEVQLEPTTTNSKSGATARLIDIGGLFHEDATLASEHALGFMPDALYVSPEAAANKAVSARVDIYSLGLLLYELLSGKTAVPAPGRPPEQVIDHLLGESPIPAEPLKYLVRDIPEEMDMLLGKCLDRNVAARPGSADQLLRGLHHVLRVFHESHRDHPIPQGLWGRLKG